MIKSELVAGIAAQNPHLYNRDIQKIVEAILNQIVSAMAEGNRVELGVPDDSLRIVDPGAVRDVTACHDTAGADGAISQRRTVMDL